MSCPVFNNPSATVIKLDQCRNQSRLLGRIFEGILENRFPHNAVLEPDIRTRDKLATGFELFSAVMRGLCASISSV
jgi:hypothetical protein